ncbi:MAG: deoxyribonuclease IV [Patescibacteria group bacterium]|jgi:deoxyribonuclease-4
MVKIGAHVSAAGGVANAPLHAHEEDLEAFQFFSRPPQSFQCPELTETEVDKFLDNVKKYKFKNYYIHAPYLVNLASANNRIRYGSINLLKQELERGTKLKAMGVIFHVGSASGQLSRQAGLETAISSLNKVLIDYKGKCKLMLENAAGSGNVLGCTLAELKQLYSGIAVNKNKIGFCLDTQHAFASGYDLTNQTAITNFLQEIGKILVWKNVLAWHFNDSKMACNSKRDRHEHIGQGLIGQTGFKYLINHASLKKADVILETPFIDRSADITLLKQLRKS